MEEYKPNSHKYKETQKNVENNNEMPVEKRTEEIVMGPVKRKKKSKIGKFADEFISEDAKNVKSYVFGEVLIPAIKKGISDIVVDGINIILYGESRKNDRRGIANSVSYTKYYDNRPSRPINRMPERNGYSYDDIILGSRGEAEDVLTRLDELIDRYGVVRVADLYDLVGVTGNYTDNYYGWNDIRTADYIRVKDGYMIRMPRAVPIER